MVGCLLYAPNHVKNYIETPFIGILKKKCCGIIKISFLLGSKLKGISELKSPYLTQHSFLQFFSGNLFCLDGMFECCTTHINQNIENVKFMLY